MAEREVIMLGTASRAPTVDRNQTGCLLRWDGVGILFDPGEGTQRQLARAGVSATTIDRICITHFHGDHCLGLPGVIMRLSTDGGRTPIPIHYPASGQDYFDRLCAASASQEAGHVDARPVEAPGPVMHDERFSLSCASLSHAVDTIGYRLEEAPSRHFVVERLAARGISGPDIGRLRDDGVLALDGQTVHVDEVSEMRPGQVFAFVMDTRWCDAALELAHGADLLVCESTFLTSHERLADEYGHLSARQAGRLAREAGARRLVLTHFSRRHHDRRQFEAEARVEFDDVVVAEDLQRIAVAPRR